MAVASCLVPFLVAFLAACSVDEACLPDKAERCLYLGNKRNKDATIILQRIFILCTVNRQAHQAVEHRNADAFQAAIPRLTELGFLGASQELPAP